MRSRLGPASAVAAAVVLVAIIAAVSGPVRTTDPLINFDEIFAEVELPEEIDDATADEETAEHETSPAASIIGAVLSSLITIGIFLAVAIGLWKLISATVRAVPARQQFEDDAVIVENLRHAAQDEADTMAAIESGAARDAVVACWVRLERATAAAGTGRDAAQTPTEFTVTVLTRHRADVAAVDRLLSLYHLARFSSAMLPDGAGAEASEALRRISETLTPDTEHAS